MTWRRRTGLFCALALAGALPAGPAGAAGHGPLFGLATPTNGTGALSIDVGWMGVSGPSHQNMARLMAAYGLTQDLQLSVSGPLYHSGNSLGMRGLAMMPMTDEIELMVADRFHHQNTGVGRRREDTAYLAVSTPNGGITRPGIFGALAHGDVSRASYWWEGIGYKAYASGGSHPGNELFYSIVLGYRPRAWRTEFPKPDFRLLLELTGEVQQRGERHGVPDIASGGHRLFLAPGVLGTYNNWGVSAGIGFPLLQDLPHGSRRQDLRFGVDVTGFF